MQVEVYDNKVCLSAGWLMDVCGWKKEYYHFLVKQHHITVVRHGGGKNRPALVQWINLPDRFRDAVLLHGNPDEESKKNMLSGYLFDDPDAESYFANYLLPDGRNLTPDTRREYKANAEVLNAVKHMLKNSQATVKSLSGNRNGKMWENIAYHVQELDRKLYPHNLPANPLRLKGKLSEYIEGGYQILIHKNFCNQLARVVDYEMERLVLSLYSMGNKPYGSWVLDYYLQFLSGGIDVVDVSTGELYDRKLFFDKNGNPKIVSEATIRNIINNPANRVAVDSVRMSYHQFGQTIRPHVFRGKPEFSLSKISLDDRDLPRRLHDGSRVKAYYAYDVCSGALIGVSYSRKKDSRLFIDCLRDMFHFLDRRGLGVPAEAEVENHLVRQFEDDLMKANTVFPFVRWCAPTNSQEKHAEHFNRQKKYGYEKRYQDGIGRWYLKDKSNQTEGERVYDEATNKYIIKEKTYDYDQLRADDLLTIQAYNNGLHYNQKKYPGKTRIQVFEEHLYPNLVRKEKYELYRYIGENQETTIKRNQYCRVQYADYMLPSADVLRRMLPGNYSVKAYYVPQEDGSVGEVYLYQNDVYLCTAKKIEPFTTARVEWTEKDDWAALVQNKYIAHFDKNRKDDIEKYIFPAKILPVTEVVKKQDTKVEIITIPEQKPECDDIDSLIEMFSYGVKERAFEMA